MLEIADLRAFVQVASSGSFSAAARALGLTASATSKAVARLELHLGTKLFIRTTRSVRLSEAGGAFFERVPRVLAELAEAEHAAQASRAAPRGLLRVEVPLALGVHRIAPLLPEFCRRYPEVELELRSSDRVVDLVAEEVDVAVRIGVLADAALIARRIGTSRVVTLAAPAYCERHGRPRAPDELARHVCLTFRSSNSGRVHPWRFAKGEHGAQFRPTRAHAFTNTETMLAAARAGLGIAQVLDFSAGPARSRRELARVLRAYEAEGPPISLVFRPERAELPKVRAFTELVAAAFVV